MSYLSLSLSLSLSLYIFKTSLGQTCCLNPSTPQNKQGDRTKNVGVVDAEYIVHYGRPTLGGNEENEVRFAKSLS
jgi:hypothetical protein